MAPQARQAKPRELVMQAGYADAFGDETRANVPCVACGAAPPDGVDLRLEDNRAQCQSCSLDTTAIEYLWRAISARRPQSPAMATQRAVKEEKGPGDETGVATADPTDPQAIRVDAVTERASDTGLPKRNRWGERLIIGALALACFVAGLMAAGLSGWANHQAFGDMVEDPLQSQVWAWTGVIASICSFGGFTFVYWHFSAGRRKEGLRAIAFAVAGAVTSVVGTDMFMANQDMARAAEAQALMARQPVIEAQIADWRAQLDGIPAATRTVEGLEAYLAEVERVGRDHQKPYRDAKVELGQARRRAELEARIADARTQLLSLGNPDGAEQSRRAIPSLFFAVMLEVFASQGTSIGLVALLILLGSAHGQPRDTDPVTS